MLIKKSKSLKTLCATSGVGNSVIDCSSVGVLIRIDFPPSLLDVNQEKCRASRFDGTSHSYCRCRLCISLESFLKLHERMWRTPSLDSSYGEAQEHDLFQVAQLFLSTECYAVAIETHLGNDCMLNATLGPCGHSPNFINKRLFYRFNRPGVHKFIFAAYRSKTECTTTEIVKAIQDYNKKARKENRDEDQLSMLMHKKQCKNGVEDNDARKVLFALIVFRIIYLRFEKPDENKKKGVVKLFLAELSKEVLPCFAMKIDDNWNIAPLLN